MAIESLLERTTAGAEIIDNKIQTIKRKAYGFWNIPLFINAIYFHCAGPLASSTINPEAAVFAHYMIVSRLSG